MFLLVSCQRPPDRGCREAPRNHPSEAEPQACTSRGPTGGGGPGAGPHLDAGLQLCGPDDLGRASAPPWEVESVQLLRDLHEALASGLGEEEARVHGRADADTEERHIDEVGQALLGVERDLRPAVAP